MPLRARRVALAGLIAFAASCSTASAASLPAACSGTTGDAASLAAAITTANTSSVGPDAVQLGAGCTYMLTAGDNNGFGPNGWPPIASDITIEGNGATITRAASAPKFR